VIREYGDYAAEDEAGWYVKLNSSYFTQADVALVVSWFITECAKG
jgi:hypothetical protein